MPDITPEQIEKAALKPEFYRELNRYVRKAAPLELEMAVKLGRCPLWITKAFDGLLDMEVNRLNSFPSGMRMQDAISPQKHFQFDRLK